MCAGQMPVPLTSPCPKWYARGRVAFCRRWALREAGKSVCNEQGCGSRNGEKAAAPWAASKTAGCVLRPKGRPVSVQSPEQPLSR